MYHKVKNTLVGLVVATTILSLSYTVGRPPIDPVANIESGVPELLIHAEHGLDLRKRDRNRNRGMQGHLSMPFFSFAPLLPRRES